MSDTDRLRMRRASSDEPHACLVYHFVVVWVVWNNLWFLVWLFAIAVMSSRWRYLFIGTALMTRPKSWPVGTDHCSICYCFQGNVTTYAFELRHYLDTNLRAEICVTAKIWVSKHRMISTLVFEGRHVKCVPLSYTIAKKEALV